MAGPLPLSYSELMAWSQMTTTAVSCDEVEMLMQMDAAYLKAVADERPAPEPQKTPAKATRKRT